MIFPLERYLKDLEYIVNIDSGSADIDGNGRKSLLFSRKDLRNSGSKQSITESESFFVRW